jgi:hypothetical protein
MHANLLFLVMQLCWQVQQFTLQYKLFQVYIIEESRCKGIRSSRPARIKVVIVPLPLHMSLSSLPLFFLLFLNWTAYICVVQWKFVWSKPYSTLSICVGPLRICTIGWWQKSWLWSRRLDSWFYKMKCQLSWYENLFETLLFLVWINCFKFRCYVLLLVIQN